MSRSVFLPVRSGEGPESLQRVTSYNWPGNIRELQNVVERAVILSETNTFFVDESWLKLESTQSRQPREGLSMRWHFRAGTPTCLHGVTEIALRKATVATLNG